jgi:hypothetical protein
MQDHIGSLQHLDTIACIKIYSSQFVSDHCNVLLVTNISNSANSFLNANEHAPDSFDNFGWMCGGSYTESSTICTTAAALSHASDWQVSDSNWPVQYFLRVPFQDHCKLEVSIGILAAFRVIRRSHLITVGDAIVSFLTNADQTTAQRCLLSRRNV